MTDASSILKFAEENTILWEALILCLCLLSLMAALQHAKKTNNRFYLEVSPVSENFRWFNTPPQQYRPIKPVFHMTMNIKKVPVEDWLLIEDTYEWVTNIHRNILMEHPDETCKVSKSPGSELAIRELYDVVLGVLQRRYPEYFTPSQSKKSIINTINGMELPKHAFESKKTAEELLRILLENTEEDFQLLEHDPISDEYVVRGIGGLTSDGYSWRSKLDKKLTDVHGPVPGYKEKLKTSMNRYFKRLEPGNFVQRLTWGIHLGSCDQVYHPKKPRVHGPGNEVVSVKEDDIDFENGTWMRLERQVPTKLPKSGFLVLSQHTYWYPLKQLKVEGLGPLMADALEAWPDLYANYKGHPVWGPAIIPWLRKE